MDVLMEIVHQSWDPAGCNRKRQLLGAFTSMPVWASGQIWQRQKGKERPCWWIKRWLIDWFMHSYLNSFVHSFIDFCLVNALSLSKHISTHLLESCIAEQKYIMVKTYNNDDVGSAAFACHDEDLALCVEPPLLWWLMAQVVSRGAKHH